MGGHGGGTVYGGSPPLLRPRPLPDGGAVGERLGAQSVEGAPGSSSPGLSQKGALWGGSLGGSVGATPGPPPYLLWHLAQHPLQLQVDRRLLPTGLHWGHVHHWVLQVIHQHNLREGNPWGGVSDESQPPQSMPQCAGGVEGQGA